MFGVVNLTKIPVWSNISSSLALTEKTPVSKGDKGIVNLSQNWLLERVERTG
jgi:hypothetical protein